MASNTRRTTAASPTLRVSGSSIPVHPPLSRPCVPEPVAGYPTKRRALDPCLTVAVTMDGSSSIGTGVVVLSGDLDATSHEAVHLILAAALAEDQPGRDRKSVV